MIWQVQQHDPDCVVIVDQFARTGADNMDLDQRALELTCREAAADAQSPTICRIYRWDQPTVTVGYFQDLSVPVPDEISGCPRVKRLTGGGAILHDLEFTYSVVVPARHSIRSEPLRLYDVVHTAIINTLAIQEIRCCMRQDSPLFRDGSLEKTTETTPEPFLCFLRQDDRDIVIGKDKIVGSAQRRRKGSILQHGSILLRASKLIPDVVGLHDLEPSFDSEAFLNQIAEAIGKSISNHFEILKLDDGEQKLHQLLT
ncbi:MAG: hypothetical protein ABJZ55_08580 [Fuerstiella sp.]